MSWIIGVPPPARWQGSFELLHDLPMTDKERLIRARIALLTLAAEVHNVARACKLARVSRSQFYAMRKAYEAYGEEGLVPRVRRKPDMPNRTPAHLEDGSSRARGKNPC